MLGCIWEMATSQANDIRSFHDTMLTSQEMLILWRLRHLRRALQHAVWVIDAEQGKLYPL